MNLTGYCLFGVIKMPLKGSSSHNTSIVVRRCRQYSNHALASRVARCRYRACMHGKQDWRGIFDIRSPKLAS